MPEQRGVTENEELNEASLLRDTRTLGQKFSDFFKKPTNVSILITVTGLTSFFVPLLSNFLFIAILFFLYMNLTQKSHLPFRLPMRSKELDYNDARPDGKFNKARGIYCFGNQLKTSEELWFGDDDMRTHCLVFGSTGSGKTVFLTSLTYNALVQSSGFIYVDGKADNSLFAKIFAMMKYMGREDDLLLINFMTGAKDIQGAQENKQSNTMNPFSSGSSGMLSNLVASMMDSGSGGGDGDMWKGRAIAFVESLFKILVYQRDAGNILLDANTIRNYFSLERLEAMVGDKVFIRDGQFDISLEDVPETIMQPITNYLATLPGYVKERKGKQVSQVYEQHGYITMQLTRTFTSLADSYGHIMRTKLAEVDMRDVVLNRRVLVVLLPALEKSPDELANLGKIVISSLKTMMASGLGDTVEGTYQDVILRKPTNCPTPFLCVLDEYGYYAVKGFAVVPAQARSLGFSVVFAGQDLPAFQKASKEEAASIGANTNIKICMKLEDPTDTWEFFLKSAGDAYVTAVESFSAQNPGLTGTYMDSKSAKAEKRARINLLDLKEQGVGEAHVFFKSRIIRANLFFMDPGPAKAMRLNVLLKVEIPKDEVLYTLVKSIEDFESLVKTQGVPQINVEKDEDLERIVAQIKEESLMIDSIDRGINVLFELHKQSLITEEVGMVEAPQEAQWKEASEEDDDGDDDAGPENREDSEDSDENIEKEQTKYIDILMHIKLSKREKETMAVEEDLESYGLPMIDQAKLTSSAMYLLRQLGRSKGDADEEIKRTTGMIKEKSLYNGGQMIALEALSERIETLVKALSN
jgi:intracellular multiplication protein IcmO